MNFFSNPGDDVSAVSLVVAPENVRTWPGRSPPYDMNTPQGDKRYKERTKWAVAFVRELSTKYEE